MTTEVETLKIGDRVITSKGRFGIIKSVHDKYTYVTMGNKVHEIYQNELLLLSNAKALEVEYYKDFINTYDLPNKEIIYISKRLTIYDFNNPMNNSIIDECKIKLMKRINYTNIIITKIKLI